MTPRPPTLLLIGLVACSCSSDGRAGPRPVADLRGDANRDGEVRFDDDADDNDTEWSRLTGPVFLANIDDDGGRCAALPADDDLALPLCNDAADEIVNGEADARDLARLKTRPTPEPADATGRVVIETGGARELVRLFQKIGAGPTDLRVVTQETVFSRDELEAGLELAIEAKDIVRDLASWDGYVDVRLTVTSSRGVATDVVRMRLAPVLTYHHLLPAEIVWMPDIGTLRHDRMREDLEVACDAAGLGAPRPLKVTDQWTQDYFEPAFMSMPGEGGAQHVMRVNYRSANVYDPTRKGRPLRDAGQVVFSHMRGADVAGIQQFDLTHAPEMDTLNSFGNWETVPPYERAGASFPLGRILRGSTGHFFPDKTFSRMIDAQLQQPPIDVDTSWLYVGHVDETLSFVKAPSPRGWVLLANDARLAKEMLEDASRAGAGAAPMFVGLTWLDKRLGTRPAEITIDEVLADPLVMEASAEAAVEVDAQVEILKRETGLRDDEIVRVPFLHTLQASKSVAYQPALVNGLYTSDTRFAAPEPHGPVIDGEDIFKANFAASLGALGITVDWIEDWDAYHRIFGEVHCGTNATRRIPEARWWESGR